MKGSFRIVPQSKTCKTVWKVEQTSAVSLINGYSFFKVQFYNVLTSLCLGFWCFAIFKLIINPVKVDFLEIAKWSCVNLTV